MLRELRILYKNPIFWFCMMVFPIAVMFFFTSMMEEGLPQRMPIGIVDQDNTSTTRSLIRLLDSFQNSEIVNSYPTAAAARQAMQQNEIYAFLYMPKGTTEKLLSSRQPKISYYYNLSYVMAGSLLMKDLKVISSLGSAAVGRATMRAKGFTDEQIMAFL